MLPSWSVARFAPNAHFRPGRLELLVGDVEALDDVGGVAVETVGVPDLADVVRAFRNRRDFLPVNPALVGHMPEHRQDVDASLRKHRQIALVALGAERVVDAEGLGRLAAECDRNEGLAVFGAEGIRPIVIGEFRPGTEISDDRRFRDRLRHLDVQRILPGAKCLLMASLAGRRS